MSKSSNSKARRGFAAMSLRKRQAIARKGGLSSSRDLSKMRRLGRKGGRTTHSRYIMVPRALSALHQEGNE